MGKVFAYTKEPPPTPVPDIITICLKILIFMIPKKRREGIHNHFRRFQLVLAKSSDWYHLPFSITKTLYPFSESRKALTEPPNPLPIIM